MSNKLSVQSEMLIQGNELILLQMSGNEKVLRLTPEAQLKKENADLKLKLREMTQKVDTLNSIFKKADQHNKDLQAMLNKYKDKIQSVLQTGKKKQQELVSAKEVIQNRNLDLEKKVAILKDECHALRNQLMSLVHKLKRHLSPTLKKVLNQHFEKTNKIIVDNMTDLKKPGSPTNSLGDIIGTKSKKNLLKMQGQINRKGIQKQRRQLSQTQQQKDRITSFTIQQQLIKVKPGDQFLDIFRSREEYIPNPKVQRIVKQKQKKMTQLLGQKSPRLQLMSPSNPGQADQYPSPQLSVYRQQNKNNQYLLNLQQFTNQNRGDLSSIMDNSSSNKRKEVQQLNMPMEQSIQRQRNYLLHISKQNLDSQDRQFFSESQSNFKIKQNSDSKDFIRERKSYLQQQLCKVSKSKLLCSIQQNNQSRNDSRFLKVDHSPRITSSLIKKAFSSNSYLQHQSNKLSQANLLGQIKKTQSQLDWMDFNKSEFQIEKVNPVEQQNEKSRKFSFKIKKNQISDKEFSKAVEKQEFLDKFQYREQFQKQKKIQAWNEQAPKQKNEIQSEALIIPPLKQSDLSVQTQSKSQYKRKRNQRENTKIIQNKLKSQLSHKQSLIHMPMKQIRFQQPVLRNNLVLNDNKYFNASLEDQVYSYKDQSTFPPEKNNKLKRKETLPFQRKQSIAEGLGVTPRQKRHAIQDLTHWNQYHQIRLKEKEKLCRNCQKAERESQLFSRFEKSLLQFQNIFDSLYNSAENLADLLENCGVKSCAVRLRLSALQEEGSRSRVQCRNLLISRNFIRSELQQ